VGLVLPTAQLSLLDGFELMMDGKAVELTLNAQRLVAFVAINGKPLQRLYIAGILWPDSSDKHAGASLRSTLWRLRRSAPGLIESRGTRLALSPHVIVDVREMIAALRALDENPSESPPRLSRHPLRAELLPDWYDAWVQVEREQYRQFTVHALESLGEKLAIQGRFGEAVQAALAAIAAEPLRDSAHRLLINVYLGEGNRSEAIREYRGYCDVLKKELGVEPPWEIQSLLAAASVSSAAKFDALDQDPGPLARRAV
jgi:DNA-binding SARP family transcriptional activator